MWSLLAVAMWITGRLGVAACAALPVLRPYFAVRHPHGHVDGVW